MIARILIWNLADSMTTIDELRMRLPEPPEGAYWISNEVAERFGVIAVGEELPDLAEIQALIGVDPVIGEEFDVE